MRLYHELEDSYKALLVLAGYPPPHECGGHALKSLCHHVGRGSRNRPHERGHLCQCCALDMPFVHPSDAFYDCEGRVINEPVFKPTMQESGGE